MMNKLSYIKDKEVNRDDFSECSLKKHKSIYNKIFLTDIKRVEDLIDKENVMGIIEYKNNSYSNLSDSISEDIPYLGINTPPYEGDSFIEVWTSSHKVSYGKIGIFKFATDGENIFGTAFQKEEDKSLAQIGENIYNQLFALLYELDYPYLYRIWNFISDINIDEKAECSSKKHQYIERYKSFCYGRATSFFNNNSINQELRFPAATGIGSLSGGVNVYFISSSLPRRMHIENPNQLSAYKYPKKYGPKSPSFARATYYSREDNSFNIYVSGTASIKGHETKYKDDIEKQCQVTFDNIKVLISKKNLMKYGINSDLTLKDLNIIKVYIRKDEDFPIVKKMCQQVFSDDSVILYLKADICRSDLLVEIEGVI